MRKLRCIIVAAFSAICAVSPAYPETAYIFPETEYIGNTAHTVLLRHEAWVIEHQYNAETGEQTCDADIPIHSTSDDFSMFSVSVQGNGSVNLLIVGSRNLWRGEFQDDLFLAIDNEKWTLSNANFDSTNGPYGSSRVRFGFGSDPAFQRFMNQLYNGRSVTLLDARANGDLITWSLAGASVALLKLTECSERIGAMNNSSFSSGYGGN